MNISKFSRDSLVAVVLKLLFCNLGSDRLPALLTICLFGCLACVWSFVCRLSKHFFAVHSVVIVCARDIRLLFKLLVSYSFEMY